MSNSNEETDQFDIFKFLSDGPKIIKEFRESSIFYVKEYGRGVYPRSLMNMLEDLEMVKRFRPYKSTDEEIEEFSEELNGVSEDRRKILEHYVSWRLTTNGRQVLQDSEDMAIEPEEESVEKIEPMFKTRNADGTSKINILDTIPEKNTHSEEPIEEVTPSEKKSIELEKPQVPPSSKYEGAKVTKFIPEDEEPKLEKDEMEDIKKSVDQNIDEMKIVEERDESELIEEEITTKRDKITELKNEYDGLGIFDRSRKKEISNDIERLEKEIEELKKKL